MSEVGLLPFAHIALQVSKAVLPRFRPGFDGWGGSLTNATKSNIRGTGVGARAFLTQ